MDGMSQTTSPFPLLPWLNPVGVRTAIRGEGLRGVQTLCKYQIVLPTMGYLELIHNLSITDIIVLVVSVNSHNLHMS